MSVKGFVFIVVVCLLQACGGGGSSDGLTPLPTPVSSSSVTNTPSSTSSSVTNTSSSTSSKNTGSSSSMPADFPIETADTLPVLDLKTDNSASIISKEDYIKGSFTLADVGGVATPVSGTLEVRGRGNSTWTWVKKPYRLKLTNSTSLLGMPKGKNWVLLANYADKTLMRNDIAFMFSRNLGVEYTPRSRYVELQLNGVYQGVYQLTEHIRVDSSRVNIPELKVGDTAADKISGGYLLEVDFRHNKAWCLGNTWDSFCVNNENTLLKTDYCIESNHGMQPFCVDTPESLIDNVWTAQREYITKYINDTETTLFGVNFKNVNTGYNAYLDVDSVIDYFLVNELLRNVDGAVSSFYMYKKRDGKLFFGPVWDFDLAMGNVGYDDANNPAGWHIRQKPWFDRLFQDPAFKVKVKERWNTLKSEGKLDYIVQYAQARAAWLDTQQKKNYELWSINDFAVWILHPPLGTYDLEVQSLINWQKARITWLDTELNK